MNKLKKVYGYIAIVTHIKIYGNFCFIKLCYLSDFDLKEHSIYDLELTQPITQIKTKSVLI